MTQTNLTNLIRDLKKRVPLYMKKNTRSAVQPCQMPNHDSDMGHEGAGSLISQKRGFQKCVFEFVYHGTFNIEIWKDHSVLGLKSVKLCMGTQGYWYALIKIATKRRASHIQKIFEAYA